MSHPSTLPSIGELFSSTWKEYKNRFQLFFRISVVVNAIILVLQLIQLYINDSSWFILLVIIMAVIMIYVSVWTQGALTLAVRSSEKNDWQSFFKQSHSRLSTLFGVCILSGLAAAGGFILVVIPGIIFAIWFAFAGYFVMYENKGVIDSMKASKALVKGNLFNLFWRWTLIIIVYIVLNAIVGGIAGAANYAASTVLTSIISTLAMPFLALYGYHLYSALKRHSA